MASSFACAPPSLTLRFPPLPHASSLPAPKQKVEFRGHARTSVENWRRSFVRNGSQISSTATYRNQREVVVPASVPVRVAHELLQAGHHYLDVRTVDEFNAGHAMGAINIPYMLKVGSGVTKYPNFLKEVSSAFGKDDEIIIGCQSGRRSLMAAAELSSAGFTGITDIAGGYSVWAQNRLPTEQ